jgi:hypothetical protein
MMHTATAAYSICTDHTNIAGALQTAGGDRYIAVVRGTDVSSDVSSTSLTYDIRTPMQPVEAVVVPGLAGSGNYTATYNVPQVSACTYSVRYQLIHECNLLGKCAFAAHLFAIKCWHRTKL